MMTRRTQMLHSRDLDKKEKKDVSIFSGEKTFQTDVKKAKL